MWTKIKWGIRILLVLIVGLFLHYTLPQRDVVQIINTYNKNTPIGGNWMFYSIEDTGTGVETTAAVRDIRYIDAVFPDGQSVMVYRNEDTDWFWPPYFKWDSSTLQAEATNLKSDKANPQWVAVTHYGWRMPIFFCRAYTASAMTAPIRSAMFLLPKKSIICATPGEIAERIVPIVEAAEISTTGSSTGAMAAQKPGRSSSRRDETS